MMIGLLLHSMRPAAFSFAIFICLYLLSRHRRAGIFCFYLESGEVLRKYGSVLVSPGWEIANKTKRYQGKSLILFGAEGETRQGAALSVRCANDPILCPFLLRKKMDGRVLVSPRWGKLQQKEKVPRKILDTFWRRRRDSNSRAGCPTYALSRGASSPT